MIMIASCMMVLLSRRYDQYQPHRLFTTLNRSKKQISILHKYDSVVHIYYLYLHG